MLVPDKRTDGQMPVIQSGHEMCGEEPRGRLEPDPIFASIGDLPSAHPLRRRPRLQAQTEDAAPDNLAAQTRHIFDRGTRPPLRRGVSGSVSRHRKEVDGIGTVHTAEGADRLRDAVLLDHGRHVLLLSSGCSYGCIEVSIARICSCTAWMACRGRIIIRNSTMRPVSSQRMMSTPLTYLPPT